MDNYLLKLKKLVEETFSSIIPNIEDYDLQALLNEVIFFYKSSNTPESIKIVDSLYDLKKVRNEIAHQKQQFSKFFQISIYTRIHNFIELIISHKIGNYEGSYVKEFSYSIEEKIKLLVNENTNIIRDKVLDLPSILELYEKTENIMYEEKAGQIDISVNTSLESYILGISRMKVQLFNLMNTIDDLKFALQNSDMEKVKMIDSSDFRYLSDDDVKGIFSVIMAAIKQINIEDSDEWKDSVAWSDPYDNLLFETININISDIISLIKKKNKIELTEVAQTKENINSSMVNNKMREKLIILRERIIKETRVDRKACILRRTNIDAILKYSIKNREEIYLYLIDKEDSLNGQERYIDEIINILNTKT